MELTKTTGAFTAIVGLLCLFRAEQRRVPADEYQSFMDWLAEKNHDGVVKTFEQNPKLALAVDSFLQQGHKRVMSTLEFTDKSLTQMASHMEGLEDVSRAIAPDHELPEQAYSILEQLVASEGSAFVKIKTLVGTAYQLMDASGQLRVDEPRFADDDIEQLCDLGLLLSERDTGGSHVFRLTRVGANYIRRVQELA